MESTKTSLWLFLLLNLLQFCLSDEDLNNSTTQPDRYVNFTNAFTSFPDTGTNGTRGDCLIDTEMGLIALGSAGGLIVCLLTAIVVLACEVCRLQRRASAPRISQSNIDLVSNAGYWGTDQAEVQGLVGPCDTNVILEEVTPDSYTKDDVENGRQGAMAEDEENYEEMAKTFDYNDVDNGDQMPTSNVRDSCLVVPLNLEDMPLVV